MFVLNVCRVNTMSTIILILMTSDVHQNWQVDIMRTVSLFRSMEWIVWALKECVKLSNAL